MELRLTVDGHITDVFPLPEMSMLTSKHPGVVVIHPSRIHLDGSKSARQSYEPCSGIYLFGTFVEAGKKSAKLESIGILQ